MILFKVLLIHLIVNRVVGQNAARILNRDLIMHYDMQSRPVQNVTVVTDVCVGLYILQIVDLSEKTQVMTCNKETLMLLT